MLIRTMVAFVEKTYYHVNRSLYPLTYSILDYLIIIFALGSFDSLALPFQ